MAKKGKILVYFFIFAFILAVGAFFYVWQKIYYSHGSYRESVIFEIKKGESNSQIAENLKSREIISGKVYFWIYLKTHRLQNKVYPGQYLLSGNLKIPEIASAITNSKRTYEKVLFREGITAEEMAEELSNHGFDGKVFLDLVNSPPEEILSLFSVVSGKSKSAALEGYLFPDTYYFSKDATPEGILKKILNNTEIKITADMKNKIRSQERSLFEVLTMASIIEKEVKTDQDRAMVSGIFWNRVEVGQALQSCATLAFILKENKKQYSFEDTRVNSPYNTYINRGLPPGPIGNPGLASIMAAIYPQSTDYNYFLTDPATGKTIYSKTIVEHNANKARYGL